MNLLTSIALRSGLDTLIGAGKLDEGRYEVNETVTLNVVGIVSKGKDTDKKPSLPLRQAIAYLLDKDVKFGRALTDALEQAQLDKNEEAEQKTTNRIKRGMARLEIIESEVVEELEVPRPPVCGSTKCEVDLLVIEDGELVVSASPLAGASFPR
jgi:hypothetical protein